MDVSGVLYVVDKWKQYLKTGEIGKLDNFDKNNIEFTSKKPESYKNWDDIISDKKP